VRSTGGVASAYAGHLGCEAESLTTEADRVFLNRLSFATLVVGVLVCGAVAQTGLAQQSLPPVAAPTSTIEVAPIEVVRSVSELVNDFGGGLMQGLMVSSGRRSGMIIAVQDNRIIASRSVGCCIATDAGFAEGLYSDLFATIAALQLIGAQRLRLDDVVPQGGNVTVEQVLTHQADPNLLRPLIETASGSGLRDYISQNILAALGTNEPAEVVGRLLVALLNDGAFEGREIFPPETNQLMAQSRFMLHPALPGWTYGFAEMRRNGWRALQWDGQWSGSPASEARLVIVPDANLAYFVVVDGHAGSMFWRVLDDGLFDRILTPRVSPAAEVPQEPAPGFDAAMMIAGDYEADSGPLSSAAPLKSQDLRLIVRVREDGSLIVSGGENAVLAPQPGGYWAAEGGNLNAAAQDGRLMLGSGLYRPLALWKRPALYASMALAFGLAAAAASYGERRVTGTGIVQSRIRVALLCAVAVLLAAALFAWHASPALF
jgi:hypothetical protein